MQNSRQSYVNLALATAAFTVAFAAWSTISPLSPQIQARSIFVTLTGAVKDGTGSYALGFVVLATLAAFCLALRPAGPQRVPAIAGGDSDVYGRLVNFLLYRESVHTDGEDATARLDRAETDARSIIALVQGRDLEGPVEFNGLNTGAR
jgi:hypothetical protein